MLEYGLSKVSVQLLRGASLKIMLQDTPTEIGEYETEAEAFEDFEPHVERLNPLFDFLHAILDRIQDVAEFLLECVFSIVRSWIFQFTSGLVAGLLFISIVVWLVKAAIGFFAGIGSA